MMIGKKFGEWVVINDTETRLTKRNLKAWICKCVCGKVKIVSEQTLKIGKSKSCGCTNPWREWKGPK